MKKPFHALHLRVFALLFMLLDHMWITVIPGNDWMNCVGRLAFPIFAFQAAEGYVHTSDFRRYIRRLLVFALISEIPLNLMGYGSVWYPFHQNVSVTMLLGLLALHAWERADGTKGRVLAGLAVALLAMAAEITCVDYGSRGVLTVVAFGVLRNMKWAQLLAMVLLHIVTVEGRMLPLGQLEVPVQGFAVLSLVLIWLYNGEKGPRNRLVQYGYYWFYPAHMLVLHLVRNLAL